MPLSGAVRACPRRDKVSEHLILALASLSAQHSLRLNASLAGAYTTHQLVCRMALTSYDQIPSELAPYAFVEFTMPATQVSHTTVRSVSVQDSDADEPPEKYVRYLARHEYK